MESVSKKNLPGLPLLPAVPVVSIRANSPLVLLPARDLWNYRALFVFLIWRDLKLRYKQTALGVMWAILQPLLATFTITVFFGSFVGLATHSGTPYALYVFSGMVPWTFFANTVATSSNSLLRDTNLITKVYFPRMIIPAASIGSGLLDFGIGFAVLLLLMPFYHWPWSWGILLVPLLTLLLAGLTLATGLFTSALAVQYRDIRFIVPFGLQIWMFASPVIYPSSRLHGHLLQVMNANPVSGILGAYRHLLLGEPFHLGPLLYSAGFTLVFLLIGLRTFRGMERSFSDII